MPSTSNPTSMVPLRIERNHCNLSEAPHSISAHRTVLTIAQGVIRTYIAGNTPPTPEVVAEGLLHNETWAYYPDDKPRRWDTR